MEQQFQLKHYGGFSIFEQNNLSAEDRNWYMRRLEREFKEKAEREKRQAGSMPHISKPHISKPSIPSIRRH